MHRNLLQKWGAVMRIGVIGAALCLCFVGICQAQSAHASIRKDANIPAAPLGSALQDLAKTYGLQLLYHTELAKDLRSPGASGALTSDEAITKVLNGTGLTYKFLDANTITVYPTSESSSAQSTENASSGSSDDASTSRGGGKKTSQEFRVAQVDQGKGASTTSVGSQTSNSQENSNSPSTGLSEVIVTAQKRSERLQDVPVPVTALDADSLVSNNDFRLQDYYAQVPGLDLSTGNRGETFLAIRGITSGFYVTPTVGVVVDDVPYGASTASPAYGSLPDIDPSDLARVEVLRGPQGTLYGADSMGGLIKFVTIAPSTDGVSGRVQADGNSVYNGDGAGYGLRGSANVPLSDTVAVRASAFTRRDPGYIDNVQTGQDGVNKTDVSGGRLAALWRPSEAFSLKLSALFQDSKIQGSPDVTVGLGDLQQSDLIGTGYRDEQRAAYNATLTAKLWGGVDLTAISGYNINTVRDSGDLTRFFASMSQQMFGVPGTAVLEDSKNKKFVQEIRLSAPIGPQLDWLFGAFYTREDGVLHQNIQAESQAGAFAGQWLGYDAPSTYSEYAAFADLTFHVTDRFDVQIGGRESEDRLSTSSVDIGPLVGGTVSDPEVSSKENTFNYLLTPSFKVSSDLMIYSRLASGFRPGGPNLLHSVAPELPASFKADKTQNYEIGAKGDVRDHALSFDLSVFYVAWKDMQINLTDPSNGLAYNANGSGAKSQGLELSLESRPLTGLTMTASGAWTDSVLTEAFPAATGVVGAAGDRLPFSSRFSGHFSVQQDCSLPGSATGFVGGAASYVGDRLSEFTGTAFRQPLPGYAKFDFRAGAKISSWTATFYVTNLADKRGVISASIGVYPVYGFDYITPRTAGLSIAKTF
jgi:iron complex outermembrane receptor protein